MNETTLLLLGWTMLSILKNLNSLIWGIPMLTLLMGTHLYFTFRSKGIQKKIFHAIKLSVTPEEEDTKKNKKKSGLSGFAALSTTLAATLGTGNIVGVSTAVALGGPGAIFWCWITGIGGMATSYAECYLSILYRKKNKDGTYQGGPMYLLEYALHKKGLAIFYAVCTMFASFGVGCTTQSNAITETTLHLWNLSPYMVGIVVAVLTGFVLIGGIQSIGKVCEKLVPGMALFYVLGCGLLLFYNREFLISALLLIMKSAFSPSAALGGVVGTTVKEAARYGISRGLFTNEAGLGSAAIAAAASHTKNPKRQALISMTATFWDTVVMCFITGLVIISNLIKNPASTVGSSSTGLTARAFASIPFYGETFLGISLIAFAIATLIGWSYFGQQAVIYLFGEKGIKPYQVAYLVMIFVGGIMSLDMVWELTDFLNAFMAFPNLLAIFLLRKKIKY